MDDSVVSGAVAGGLGVLGRLTALAHMERRPFGWNLLWELPVAISMGLIGAGIAEYFHVTGTAGQAIAVSAGYVGPRLIDMAADIIRDRVSR